MFTAMFNALTPRSHAASASEEVFKKLAIGQLVGFSEIHPISIFKKRLNNRATHKRLADQPITPRRKARGRLSHWEIDGDIVRETKCAD